MTCDAGGERRHATVTRSWNRVCLYLSWSFLIALVVFLLQSGLIAPVSWLASGSDTKPSFGGPVGTTHICHRQKCLWITPKESSGLLVGFPWHLSHHILRYIYNDFIRGRKKFWNDFYLDPEILAFEDGVRRLFEKFGPVLLNTELCLGGMKGNRWTHGLVGN